MTDFIATFITRQQPEPTLPEWSGCWPVPVCYWENDEILDDALYQQVLFRVAVQPNDLMSHVQRIVFCYKTDWSHRYYAALPDLLWVLDGKGKALAWRLFNGGRALLNKTQRQQVESYLKSNDNQAVKARA